MVSKAQVKFIRSLHYKKYRKQQNLFIAEGPKVVNELLHSNLKIHSVYGTSFGLSGFKERSVEAPLYEISEANLKKISLFKTPNEVLALAEMPYPTSYSQLYQEDLLLALDRIQEPGNLGTIIRTADWFGIKGIFCSEDIVDPYNPKVVQSAMGSLFRMQVITGSLNEMLKEASQSHFIYPSTLNGKNLHRYQPEFPAIIVIGNESQGIQSSIIANAHQALSIPKFGLAESLNASISAAIFLNHFKKEGMT